MIDDVLDKLNVENGAEVMPLYDYGVGIDTHKNFIQARTAAVHNRKHIYISSAGINGVPRKTKRREPRFGRFVQEKN